MEGRNIKDKKGKSKSRHNDVTDNLINEKYDSYLKLIIHETSKVQQGYMDKGLYNSDACTGAVIAVYDKQIESLHDEIFKKLSNSNLYPEIEHLEKKLIEVTNKLYNNAKSKASSHLISACLHNLVTEFQESISKKCNNAIEGIKRKISIYDVERMEKQEKNAPSNVRDFLWIRKNFRKYWWIIILVSIPLIIQWILSIIDFIKRLIRV